jgi:hypothetical protein
MTYDSSEISISSRVFYFKVVDMLQHNWALIDPLPDGGVIVWFVGDGSGVFDELRFPTHEKAHEALYHNSFALLNLDAQAQRLLAPPLPPYVRRPHPSGPIYSSGRFWAEPPRAP